MIIDSHTHLDFKDFDDDFADILKRAEENSISHMLSISTSIGNLPRIMKRVKDAENVFISAGLHPSYVNDETLTTSKELVALSANPRVIAYGECGLDYYRGNENSKQQMQIFEAHIEASKTSDLPIIVHTRNAGDDTINALKKANGVRGVIHCFTESLDFAKAALDLGFYISFSGIVTFKNATEIQEVCSYVPHDRILVETDAPYLAPAPHRGKRNEPSYVKYTAEFIADLKNMSYAELAYATTNNFFNLFTKAKR